jgi:molybdopterin molybdotransferase
MNTLLSYSDAMAVIEAIPNFSESLGGLEFPLASCSGGILARDLVAQVPSPAFTNSAMDGIAVKFDDLGKGPLEVGDVLYAGQGDEASEILYRSGSCIRIMTGAPLPSWADTVVPIEKTQQEDDGKVAILDRIERGANIRHIGEDLPQGAPLLKKGTRLRPEDLMVAAAFGYSSLPLDQGVKVHLVSTGDELVEPGFPLKPGQVYNGSKYFLLAAASELGLRDVSHHTLPDNALMAREYVTSLAQENIPTLIVSTGAVSAGEADFIPRLAAEMDFAALFHKVAIRPGKPVFLGRRGATLWLGLPGNPISTAVGWHFFARPILAKMGVAVPLNKRSFILRNEVIKPEGLRCFYRAEVSADQRSVWVGRSQGSAHYASTLNMGAYIEFPEGQSRWPANSQVSGILIG